MKTLNSLIIPWDAFIQTIWARKKKLHFDSLWEECIQEETIIANKESILSRDEYQALTAHTKGRRKRSYFHKETHQNRSLPPIHTPPPKQIHT
jgi:hypothetical protein